MTPRRRHLSAEALRATIDGVARTGAAVTIRTRDVVCEIRPPEPPNPCDLVEMDEPLGPPKPKTDYRTRRCAPNWLRQQVLDRDGRVCAYCATVTTRPHIDHVHPRAQGGLHELRNLVVACSECNQSKGGRTVDQWRKAKPHREIRDPRDRLR